MSVEYEKLPQHLNIDDVQNEEDLLLLNGRSPQKHKKHPSNQYKVLRYFSFGVIIAAIVTLVSISLYLCLTCECISKEFKSLCDDGFCYDMDLEKFEDSDNDKIGDFIGAKKSLKSLRDIGIQTIFVPINNVSPTIYTLWNESFVEMSKEGRSIGISVILKLGATMKPEQEEFIKNVKPFVEGFIAPKDSAFFKSKDLLSDKLCYTLISSSKDINHPSNDCNGTYFENKEQIYSGNDDLLTELLKDSVVTKNSVSLLSLGITDKSSLQTRQSQFLTMLILESFTNGSMVIKSGDEISSDLNLNYTTLALEQESFRKTAGDLMNEIKLLRQYSPKLGSKLSIHKIPNENFQSVKIYAKNADTAPISEAFFMIWNQQTSDVSIMFADIVQKPDVKTSSVSILLQANTPKSKIEIGAKEFTLQPGGIVILLVKYKPTKSA